MFFGSKNDDYYVGIDFGTRSVKAVEVSMKKNKPELVNYGWITLDQVKETLNDSEVDYAELLRIALIRLLKELKPQSKKVNIAIPAFNGLVVMIDFPLMKNDEELSQAIQYEARKYIPTSLEDVNISWDRTSIDEENKTMKVILVAAPKSEVQYYDDLFEGTDVIVDSLELETFALVRSLVGKEKGHYILLDIGAKTTNLVYVEDGAVHINRNVDVGGVDITSTIAENLNISLVRAREMKESGKNFFTGPMPLVFPSLEYIVAEVRRILGEKKSQTLDAVIVSGGSAMMPGLSAHIAKVSGLKVIVGNPLSRVIIDPKIARHIEGSVGSSLAVVIGLALLAVEQKES